MTNKAKYIWFKGNVVPWEKAQIHALSHSLNYGTSLFEGIRCYQTPQGPAIFRLDDHLERLKNSAKIYHFNIPYSLIELKKACKEILIKNNLSSAYIRPLAFFTEEFGLGVCPPVNAEMNVMIAAFPWGSYLGDVAITMGIDAMISTWNRSAPNTIPTAAKAGGNYLSSVLIGSEARRHGYHEGIALDINGCLSEGAGENIFIVKDNKIITPPATSSILLGITRDSVIKISKEFGFEVKEQSISRESLYLADEVFMTGTAAEVIPVRSVDNIKIKDGSRGPVTKQIQDAYFGLFNGEYKDKWDWLNYIDEEK